MAIPTHLFPITNATVNEVYEYVVAPWVKELGLCELAVSDGDASARLPQSAALKFSSGAVCGQAIMSAVDAAVGPAMGTTERISKGTVYQHTHFLRPAVTDDLHVKATVLRFGKSTAFAEAQVTFVSSGELVAHATAEFAF